ncbi:MAG: 2-C-methyl-D-erythritol 4-phosphate cytidylyltransferase [Candidatus Tectomicrobia bacterium]|uniref:2-C-methyl-D-erythritol 4-phosphate cytidylyltransferase n=1 Tax=Tectimicrobiota bacterium TaxID=2528274 RepID=A0A933LR90_UNCTE|nr:2-C-methyl-D-erythritol 4-phosphate cytidylyltransferase [Candidatus Tectomicrobia bacterium]
MVSAGNNTNVNVAALIAAGGQGLRMATKMGRRKQFILLEGKPVLAYAIEKFQDSHFVDAIILVVPAEEIDYVEKEIVVSYAFGKVTAIVPGGKERQDSVANGLANLSNETELVIVHDGVRPFISDEMIENSVKVARECGAAIVGIKAPDTIKEADRERQVLRTLERDLLWLIQTPQTFKLSLLKQAFLEARKSGFYGTDEAALLERLGLFPKIINGSSLNIKITTPDDLALAKAILKHGLY